MRSADAARHRPSVTATLVAVERRQRMVRRMMRLDGPAPDRDGDQADEPQASARVGMIRLCHAFGGGSARADTALAAARPTLHTSAAPSTIVEARSNGASRAAGGHSRARRHAATGRNASTKTACHQARSPQRRTGGHERLEEGPRLPCRHQEQPMSEQARRQHATSMPHQGQGDDASGRQPCEALGVHRGAGVEPRASRKGDGDLHECDGRERALQHVRPGDAADRLAPTGAGVGRQSSERAHLLRHSPFEGCAVAPRDRVPFHGPAVDEGIHDEAQCRRGVTRATRMSRRLAGPRRHSMAISSARRSSARRSATRAVSTRGRLVINASCSSEYPSSTRATTSRRSPGRSRASAAR